MIFRLFLGGVFTMMLAGCQLSAAPELTATPEFPLATSATVLSPWFDANSVMSGICFESAYDAVGQVFVLRSEAELAQLFDLADHSRLCAHPVQRHSFDFAYGRVLAGLWSAGRGCSAYHQPIAFDRNDVERTITIRLQWVVVGACDYELVRPFWIGLENARDYAITIVVE